LLTAGTALGGRLGLVITLAPTSALNLVLIKLFLHNIFRRHLMKRAVFAGILYIAVFFTGCGSSTSAQEQIFGIFGNALGVAAGNSVKFYGLENYGWYIDNYIWEEESSATFNLPTGYKSVFSYYDDALGNH
jgi:hypothetical protein